MTLFMSTTVAWDSGIMIDPIIQLPHIVNGTFDSLKKYTFNSFDSEMEVA